jgi:hypothetical protein
VGLGGMVVVGVRGSLLGRDSRRPSAWGRVHGVCALALDVGTLEGRFYFHSWWGPAPQRVDLC